MRGDSREVWRWFRSVVLQRNVGVERWDECREVGEVEDGGIPANDDESKWLDRQV